MVTYWQAWPVTAWQRVQGELWLNQADGQWDVLWVRQTPSGWRYERAADGRQGVLTPEAYSQACRTGLLLEASA